MLIELNRWVEDGAKARGPVRAIPRRLAQVNGADRLGSNRGMHIDPGVRFLTQGAEYPAKQYKQGRCGESHEVSQSAYSCWRLAP